MRIIPTVCNIYLSQDLPSHFGIVVLPLHKLIHVRDHVSDDSDSDDQMYVGKDKKKKSLMQRLSKLLYPERSKRTPLQPVSNSIDTDNSTKAFVTSNGHIPTPKPAIPTRTLQRYHGGPNEERTEYMEKKSALASEGLAVSVEQVSIFLTSDNCLVSFFESSAADVETPIIGRLGSQETLLRKSTDASMILQAIIDTIIDLAIQVTRGYQNAVDELELNVLTGESQLYPH